jgi:FAD/FMN-containing dehydrogenase
MAERSIAAHDGAEVARLRRGFHGQVLLPDQDGYDQARQVWNAMVNRRPAVIARCTHPADVAAAVRFGRALGLEIGVRCGGHSVLGLSVPDGGLMLDLSPMGSVRVDPDRRRAWVQGGALLGDLDRATQPYGLATTAGNVSHTGVGGLTLGGGMGWLARRFGLACDNVARFQLVGGDGELLQASERENPELFWGLRGGGGNFGVVTEFEFHLHQVGTAALVDLFYAPQDAPAALHRWRELIAEAPPQATLTAWVGTAGELPFLAPARWGRPLASVGYVWIGDPVKGRELLPALRDGSPPVGERVQELSYLELQSMDDERQRPGLLRRYWKGHYLRDLDNAAIGAFLSRGDDDGGGEPALLPSGSLQSYGGAIAAVGEDETAFGHRDALVEFVAVAGWTDPAEDQARMAAARRYGAAVEPFASGVYVNDLTDEGQAGIRRAYRTGTLARLAALKDRYDPGNLFHLNHNIRPTVRG